MTPELPMSCEQIRKKLRIGKTQMTAINHH